MLKIEAITCGYRGIITVLREVSIALEDGQFVSIIGPNGAGKSSLLRAISGTVACSSGSIYFDGHDITPMDAHQRTWHGIIHVPENRRIFPSLTVLENLEIGAYRQEARGSMPENLDLVMTFFPILRERRNQLGGSLSGGEQQMLAIGRALMARPRLLLLDEPSLGLAPVVVDTIMETVVGLRQRGVTILMVEQNARTALSIADRGYVLETGRIILSGPAAELLNDRQVTRAYLGKDYKEFTEGR